MSPQLSFISFRGVGLPRHGIPAVASLGEAGASLPRIEPAGVRPRTTRYKRPPAQSWAAVCGDWRSLARPAEQVSSMRSAPHLVLAQSGADVSKPCLRTSTCPKRIWNHLLPAILEHRPREREIRLVQLAGDGLGSAFRAEQVSLRFVADYWRVSDAGVRRGAGGPAVMFVSAGRSIRIGAIPAKAGSGHVTLPPRRRLAGRISRMVCSRRRSRCVLRVAPTPGDVARCSSPW
jgi:hypothetical protein